MRCRQCQGSMVVDHFLDLGDDVRALWVAAWRCGQCGRPEEETRSAERRRPRSRNSRDIVALGV